MPVVSLISSVPSFILKDENISTPPSFIDLPPTLSYKEGNVSVTLDPPIEGFTEEDAAQGTLYVISSVLAFVSTTGRGFQIEYPSITLHAISRAEGQPSIYCQLDEGTNTTADRPSRTDLNGTEEKEYTSMRELSIIPQDPGTLETIFEALSQCASLHPDPVTLDEEDEAFVDDSNFEVFTGDEGQELTEVGRAALNHLESIIYNPFETNTTRDGVSEEETQTQPQVKE
ncbi:hypothetical protein AX15_001517 [Amanita polypyramis BW_CC]|nr:hypothetical protein AX15_001517 [Amanita polypyramis BW_CC]